MACPKVEFFYLKRAKWKIKVAFGLFIDLTELFEFVSFEVFLEKLKADR